MIIVLHVFLLFIAFGTIIIGSGVARKRRQMFSVFYEKMNAKNSYSENASIIAPVRGLEEHAEENILSMLKQDFKKKYEVIFVVDKDDKKTEKKISDILKNNKIKNAKIVHNSLFPAASGKSSALVAGVRHAKYPMIVSYDSDARVRDTWLADLIGPLDKKQVGVSTGFRFYMPGSFTSYLLSAWNCIGYIAVQRKQPFAWGGSFAIKKDLIKKLGLMEAWKKVISDDSAVARKVEHANMKSYFVPSCIALSFHSKFSHITEFTTRQITIIRHNWPSAYKISIIMFLGSRLSIVLGVVMFFAWLATSNILFFVESALLLFIILIELFIANMDFRNFSKILGVEIGSRSKWSVAYILGHWLMSYNILSAARKNTIEWRGRSYDFRKEVQAM